MTDELTREEITSRFDKVARQADEWSVHTVRTMEFEILAHDAAQRARIAGLEQVLGEILALVSPFPRGTLQRMADQEHRLEWYAALRPLVVRAGTLLLDKEST